MNPISQFPTSPTPQSSPKVPTQPMQRAQLSLDRVQGIMIGIALGDSLGLPVETMTSDEIAARFGFVDSFLSPDSNSLLEGKGFPLGLTSDDAQLTVAMFRACSNPRGFDIESVIREHIRASKESILGWGGSTISGVKALADGLRPGDPEFATRLKKGEGNGIPMKIAPLAAWAHKVSPSEDDLLQSVVKLCELSHATEISFSAGLAHIAAIRYCLSHTPETFSKDDFLASTIKASARAEGLLPRSQSGHVLRDRLSTVLDLAASGARSIIDSYGGGSCYVFDSLPFSYAFFLRDPYSFASVLECINAGGDTDSNGALVGGLLGALHGTCIFPEGLATGVAGLAENMREVWAFFEAIHLE